MGSGKRLKQAINKYGIENFSKEILFVFETEEEMNSKERELVTEEFCAQENNYNLCPGGNGGWDYINTSGKSSRLGAKLSESSKKKISLCKKGNQNNLGKKLSDSHKSKIGKSISISLKGKSKSEEHKRKISEGVKRALELKNFAATGVNGSTSHCE